MPTVISAAHSLGPAAAYPLALAAGAMFGMASLLEHRSAARVPDVHEFSLRRVGAFVGATVRDSWWLAGMACNTLGLTLHATALHLSALAVVQPLMVCNVLFALLFQRWRRREAVSAVELRWAAALVVGLGGFLATAVPGDVESGEPADAGPAAGSAAVAAVVVGVLILGARSGKGRDTAPTLLGVATGVVYAFNATLIKACTDVLGGGIWALVTNWQLYGLLLTGALGLTLNQLAYQAGPLAASLPAITVVDPLLAVLLGVLIFGERLRHTPAEITAEAVFLTVMALAAIALTRLQHPGAGELARTRADAGRYRATGGVSS